MSEGAMEWSGNFRLRRNVALSSQLLTPLRRRWRSTSRRDKGQTKCCDGRIVVELCCIVIDASRIGGILWAGKVRGEPPWRGVSWLAALRTEILLSGSSLAAVTWFMRFPLQTGPPVLHGNVGWLFLWTQVLLVVAKHSFKCNMLGYRMFMAHVVCCY